MSRNRSPRSEFTQIFFDEFTVIGIIQPAKWIFERIMTDQILAGKQEGATLAWVDGGKIAAIWAGIQRRSGIKMIAAFADFQARSHGILSLFVVTRQISE